MNKIKEIAALEKNWNGYDGDPIPAKVIERAKEVLRTLNKFDKKPEIFPTANDSIQFEYSLKDGFYLEFQLKENHVEVFSQEDSDSDNEYFCKFKYDEFMEFLKSSVMKILSEGDDNK